MITTWILLGALQATQGTTSKPSAPVLEFRVIGREGNPARVEVNHVFDRDCDRRVLSCVRCPSGERPDTWHGTPEGAHPEAFQPDTSFLVEPGERYVYAYIGKDIQPIVGEVTIAKDAPLTCVELRIAPDPKFETLRIKLRQPNGLPLDHDSQITIESIETGLPLFRWNRSQFKHEWILADTLPVGRYRVRIETDENAPWCGTGWDPAPAPYGDWIDCFELREGTPREIDARMWLGGKMRLALDLPTGMAPREPLWTEQHPFAGSPLESHWLGLGTRGPGARVMLRLDSDAPRPLHERGMPDVTDAPVQFFCQPELLVSYEFPALLPGREQTSADWIPPGSYIARIEARDFAPVETKVKIQLGEVTNLRVQLTAR